MQLYGRDAELAALSDLLDQARQGTSGTLVLRGDPGIGKTALVSHLIARADGFRVIRGAGIEEESELPFAGLHLLLRTALDRVDALPGVQAEALRGALGLARAGPPDRFLVGLAVLSLLAELAAEQPLLCVVDDAQWLDRASADALLFAARRLDSESIVLLLCARTGALTAAGLPALTLNGLSAQAASELLHDALPASRRYRVLAEAAGNPLALLELPRVLAGAQPEGPLPLTERLRAAFEGQLAGLPEPARTVLLVAAAEGTGDLAPILRAAGTLGASLADLDPARAAGLVEVNGSTLTFRHPLIRSAVHHTAPLAQRRAVHQALAAALDAPGQADRRAWQQAAAAAGPDEEIAAALERAAGQVRARGGDAGALAWYQRAAELSTDPVAQARRLTLAAETASRIGRSRPGRRPRGGQPGPDRDRVDAGARSADRPGAAGAGHGGVSARGAGGGPPAAARGERADRGGRSGTGERAAHRGGARRLVRRPGRAGRSRDPARGAAPARGRHWNGCYCARWRRSSDDPPTGPIRTAPWPRPDRPRPGTWPSWCWCAGSRCCSARTRQRRRSATS